MNESQVDLSDSDDNESLTTLNAPPTTSDTSAAATTSSSTTADNTITYVSRQQSSAESIDQLIKVHEKEIKELKVKHTPFLSFFSFIHSF